MEVTWMIFATLMWFGAIVCAFFAGRALGQHEDAAHVDFLRNRVSQLNDRLDKLEAK
jgi:hypothetical protein